MDEVYVRSTWPPHRKLKTEFSVVASTNEIIDGLDCNIYNYNDNKWNQ